MSEEVPEEHNAVYPYGRPRWSTPRSVPVRLKPVNGFALVALFLAVFGFSIPAIITGHVALYQLSFINMERGRTLAWIGLILGYLQVLAAVLVGIYLAIHIAAALDSACALPSAHYGAAGPCDFAD